MLIFQIDTINQVIGLWTTKVNDEKSVYTFGINAAEGKILISDDGKRTIEVVTDDDSITIQNEKNSKWQMVGDTINIEAGTINIKAKNDINIESSTISRKIDKIKTESSEDIEEVDKLLDIKLVTPFDYRNKTILELLYSTGLRATELVNLDLINIDTSNMVVSVYGKGSKERIVPLSKIAVNYLDLYINKYRPMMCVKNQKPTDSLFLNNHGKRMTRQGLYKIIGEIASSKKIDKEITPHVLRHSFATHMIECGADIRSVQELLGHENVVTTEIYTHLANNFIKENYNEYFNRSTKEGESDV